MDANVTAAEEHASFAAVAAIAATLQRYIDAARAGDGRLMRAAFLDSAHIRGTYDRKPVEWSVPEFCQAIDRGGPATGLSARVVAIGRAGNAAMARLEAENWRSTRYTDFFVLVEDGAEWRIASKVFYAHARA